MRARRLVALAAVAGVGVSGCGRGFHVETLPASRRATPPPHVTPGAAAAVRGFATRYINWSWWDVAADMARLALDSRDAARSELAMTAAQTHADITLRQAEVVNAGTVEAVAPLTGVPGQWVVVTRETTTAERSAAYEGLAPAWHVAIATVARLRSGTWVLTAWQPVS